MKQREIKFRLIKDGKIVGYEYHIPRLGRMQIKYSHVNTDWGNPLKLSYVIVHDRKDQYTGFKDKNKEIYERDIVEGKRPDSGETLRGYVWFDEGCGAWVVKSFDGHGWCFLGFTMVATLQRNYIKWRIVSNIYESKK